MCERIPVRDRVLAALHLDWDKYESGSGRGIHLEDEEALDEVVAELEAEDGKYGEPSIKRIRWLFRCRRTSFRRRQCRRTKLHRQMGGRLMALEQDRATYSECFVYFERLESYSRVVDALELEQDEAMKVAALNRIRSALFDEPAIPYREIAERFGKDQTLLRERVCQLIARVLRANFND